MLVAEGATPLSLITTTTLLVLHCQLPLFDLHLISSTASSRCRVPRRWYLICVRHLWFKAALLLQLWTDRVLLAVLLFQYVAQVTVFCFALLSVELIFVVP